MITIFICIDNDNMKSKDIKKEKIYSEFFYIFVHLTT